MRTATLFGRHHHTLGTLASVAESEAAIALTRGGAQKTYSHTELNEDAAVFALGEGGALIAVADGHHGASGSEAIVDWLLSSYAEEWTGPAALAHDAGSWRNTGLDLLYECGQAVLSRAGELGVPPAPSTLSVALARPAEDKLAWISAGDSHIFLVTETSTEDVGWASLGRDRTYYLGFEAATREGMQDKFSSGLIPLAEVKAAILATDGISEPGIGLANPGQSVAEATASSAGDDPELRPLNLVKRIAYETMEAQRNQRAGDNLACAVLDLHPPQPHTAPRHPTPNR